MNIFRKIEEIKYEKDTLITVGTFDGLHKGHKELLSSLVKQSENYKRHIVVTFDPHPRLVIKAKNRSEVKLLTTIEERLELFQSFGIQNILIIEFTEEFAQTSPDKFIKDLLYDKVGLKKIIIGYDHNFGKNREGNIELLAELSKNYDFEIEQVPPFEENGVVISSTKIRNALNSNLLKYANEMLGYTYSYSGTVVKGDGRGRSIGFPTANLLSEIDYKLLPERGVYLVQSLIDGKLFWGMANIGTRPTFTSDLAYTLEVHFLDFNDDLYDKTLKISFIDFIRNEKRFNGVSELVEQIELDKQYSLKLIENQ